MQCLMGERAGKKPLRMPAHRWEDNIKYTLKKEARRKWNGLMCLRMRQMADSCKPKNKTSNSIK